MNLSPASGGCALLHFSFAQSRLYLALLPLFLAVGVAVVLVAPRLESVLLNLFLRA